MERAAIASVLDLILAAPHEAEASPASVAFLVREYVATGREVVRIAAERGLARGLAALGEERDARVRVEWLRTLAEADACAADGELRHPIERALPDAIDALESLVRRDYEPGEGLAGATSDAQVRCASALLAAFDLTGRLPYAMLAEELLATLLHRQSDDVALRAACPEAACIAASVCCRLAALRADADYVARAVVAPGAAYRDDAGRLLAEVSEEWRGSAGLAAEYGVALLEWFALEANLQ